MIEALALASSLLASGAAPKIAVMPTLGDDAASALAAQNTIAGALADAHVKIVDDAAVTKLIVSAVESGLTCDPARAECATRICAFGGLDFVVVSEVTKTRGTVALHDCADGREVRKIGARLDDSARSAGIAALARAALAKGEVHGRVDVTAPADGAVFVDGVAHGAAPQSIEVTAGNHDVAWRAAGGTQLARTVDVPAAASVQVAFTAAAPPPPAPIAPAQPAGVPPMLAVGVAGGVIVAIGGAVGALIVAPGDRAGFSARQYNDDVLIGRVLLGTAVVGAACAIASGALILGAGGAS